MIAAVISHTFYSYYLENILNLCQKSSISQYLHLLLKKKFF